MINLIFTLKPLALLTDDEKEQFYKHGCIWVSPLPEMRVIDGVYPIQVIAPDAAILAIAKPLLDEFDIRGAVEVVGAWNVDSDFVLDLNGNIIGCSRNALYPFNVALYQSLLNDIVTYDVSGNIGSTRRPTLDEALKTQVNRYAGMPVRILE
jgi:hypothetical protein